MAHGNSRPASGRNSAKGCGCLVLVFALVAIGAAMIYGHGSGHGASAPSSPAASAAAVASHAAAAKPARCRLHTTFDYIERDVVRGIQPSAVELGNVDYGDCTPTLRDWASEAADGPGDCSTIALASANPGYNPDAVPAPPLRRVIEKAGPGC